MSLLTIIRRVAVLVGVPQPSAVIGSADAGVLQLLEYANVEGEMLAIRHPWQALTKEVTFTAVSGEDQGLIETIAPGFNWDLYETWWNRTQQNRIGGPLTPQQWQLRKAQVNTGPYYDFRIRENHLIVSPAATAGETLAFEYVSRYWCASAGGAGQEEWAADTDVGILPEKLIRLGLHWRYLRSRGLSYAEEKQTYEIAVNAAMARDGSKQTLSMEGSCADYKPGIQVPDGNWDY